MSMSGGLHCASSNCTLTRPRMSTERQIYQDFDMLTEASAVDMDDPSFDAESSPLVELRHACAVVDALSIDVREQLLRSFSKRQFQRYDEMYGAGSEGFTLGMVDRRYSWFRGFLREYDMRFANVLPKHWQVAQVGCTGHRSRCRWRADSCGDGCGRGSVCASNSARRRGTTWIRCCRSSIHRTRPRRGCWCDS